MLFWSTVAAANTNKPRFQAASSRNNAPPQRAPPHSAQAGHHAGDGGGQHQADQLRGCVLGKAQEQFGPGQTFGVKNVLADLGRAAAHPHDLRPDGLAQAAGQAQPQGQQNGLSIARWCKRPSLPRG